MCITSDPAGGGRKGAETARLTEAMMNDGWSL